MATNNLGSIRVASTSDVGCDWTDVEQRSFCAEVVSTLEALYPGVSVECDIERRAETRVWVYGRESRCGLVTHPAHEYDLLESIMDAVQDVWNRGGW